MKMILFITETYPPQKGGQSRQGEYFVSALRKQFIVDIADIHHCDRLYGPVFRFMRRFPFGLGYLLQVFMIVCTFGTRYDAVISADGSLSAIYASIYGWILRKKVILLFHGLDICNWAPGIRSKIIKFILRRNNLIICNSQRTREHALDKALGNRIVVINPPADLNKFKPLPLGSIRQRFTGHGKKIILTVSRLVVRKGIEHVLEALSTLEKDYLYIIIGDEPQENIKGDILVLIQKLGLQDRVLLLTDVQDQELIYYYNLCDLFVMTPYEIVTHDGKVNFEGFGMVYIEANACGKPVIGTRSGGIPDAIRDGYSGLLVQEKNIAQLKEAIEQMLSDESLYRKIADHAIDWAATFDTKVLGERYLNEVNAVVL